MEWLTGVDWEKIFVPNTPLIEIFLRGTLTYLGLSTILRVILKRESGSIGITDLLVVVLLADASQNALADDYRSIPDGFMLVSVILFWSHALNWLGYRYPRIQRFIRPKPLLPVENGKMLPRNMRKEFITEDELRGMLRQQGVGDLGEVKEANTVPVMIRDLLRLSGVSFSLIQGFDINGINNSNNHRYDRGVGIV